MSEVVAQFVFKKGGRTKIKHLKRTFVPWNDRRERSLRKSFRSIVSISPSAYTCCIETAVVLKQHRSLSRILSGVTELVGSYGLNKTCCEKTGLVHVRLRYHYQRPKNVIIDDPKESQASHAANEHIGSL